MNEQKKRRSKPLYKDPLKAVPLIGALIAAILGGMELYKYLFPSSHTSSIYVLDISQGMNGKLGKEDKFQRVKEHVLAKVAAFPDVPAALRLAGGDDCRVSYEGPSVGFGKDNYDEFQAALDEVRPAGKTNIANALKHAANDIVQRSERASIKVTTVYVIIGSTQRSCTPNASEAIRTALSNLRAGENVEVDFKFVGVKPSKMTKKLLYRARKDAKNLGFVSVVEFAYKSRDLEELHCDTPAEKEYSTSCP